MTNPLLSLDRLGPPIDVPDITARVPAIDACTHTGKDALNHAYVATGMVAVDIETKGTGALSFDMKCVTFAYEDSTGLVHTALLDPRRGDDATAIRDMLERAEYLVLHNAAFDWPVLQAYGLARPEHVDKVLDTVVLARMTYPDKLVSKSLSSLVSKADLLGLPDNAATMKDSFTAAGISTIAAGWELMDIDSPTYRLGAMADTALTLKLWPALITACLEWLGSNPFVDVSENDAAALIEREQITNRAMLYTAARGIAIDTGYLAKVKDDYVEKHATAAAVIEGAGLDPEAGNLGAKVVEYLGGRGELPEEWPMTATGKPKADKKAMALLGDHPLAIAHRSLADMAKVLTYLETVADYAAVTGRVHPQWGILGASATGRMSVSGVPLQQFPDDARRILVPDTGHDWTSIDWSSIEPVICANSAGDSEFLRGFNDHGADLYQPIVEGAGVDRKTAKVVLLAAMYGQGRALLASNLGVSEDEAVSIQERVFERMPKTKAFLDGLRLEGERRGVIMTADKRLLSIPRDVTGKLQGYKATNYYVQGSSLSVLSEVINTLYKRGLAGSIILAMHDELVVDSAAADEVREVMETPPAWLEDFCEAPVVLRTDSNPLNGCWKYV